MTSSENDNPFSSVERNAYALNRRDPLPIALLPETFATLRGAFGEDWLRKQAELRRRGTPFPFRVHPIGGLLSTGGREQILELVELALYIRDLVDIPSVDLVIKNMRDELQYDSSFLQLAWAFRLQRCGVSDLELEPPASGGRKADIRFAFDHVPYMVECYIPKIFPSDSIRELQYSSGAILDVIGNRRLRICIRLRRSISAKDRKRIENKIVSRLKKDACIGAINDDAASILVEKSKENEEAAEFSIPGQDPEMKLYQDADWTFCSTKTAGTVEDIQAGDYQTTRIGRIFIWRSPGEKAPRPIAQRLDELVDKISDKVTQARSPDHARRIVVMELADAIKQDSDTIGAMRELQARLISKHNNVAGFFLGKRVWTTSGRYQYRGYFVDGDQADRSYWNLQSAVNKFERDFDLSTEWK